MLKDYWKLITEYNGDLGTKKGSFVRNEAELLPFRYSQGKWQSYNSDDKNLLTIVEYIRQVRPDVVLECGTFEARATEYLARIMRLSSSHPNRTLVTIDIPNVVLHMDVDANKVTYQKEEGWSEVLKIRKARLALLESDPFVKVIYREGLTQVILPKLLQEFDFDFIYEDASHLPIILMKDFEYLDAYVKKGCVVCFDDMGGNEFKDWVYANADNWELFYTDLQRGQLWMEKL